MESIRSLYRIGSGPSSSHTMAPRKSAIRFYEEFKQAKSFEALLFGSLAATGLGHLTDKALHSVFDPSGKKLTIKWLPDQYKEYHPNALTLKAYSKDNSLIGEKTYYSTGGGKVVEEQDIGKKENSPYPSDLNSLDAILDYCETNKFQLWEFVVKFEGDDIFNFVKKVWLAMQNSVERG